MDELLEPSVVADHPERGVMSTDQIPSRLDDPTQHRRQGELTHDCPVCGEQALEALLSGTHATGPLAITRVVSTGGSRHDSQRSVAGAPALSSRSERPRSGSGGRAEGHELVGDVIGPGADLVPVSEVAGEIADRYPSREQALGAGVVEVSPEGRRGGETDLVAHTPDGAWRGCRRTPAGGPDGPLWNSQVGRSARSGALRLGSPTASLSHRPVYRALPRTTASKIRALGRRPRPPPGRRSRGR